MRRKGARPDWPLITSPKHAEPGDHREASRDDSRNVLKIVEIAYA